VTVLVFFGVIIHFFPSKRKREIQEILADLRTLKSDPDYREAAALNIEFFRAALCPISYFFWSIFRASRLRKNRMRIVELGDLPFSRWQKEILEKLSWFEAGLPMMLQPIKQGIVRELESLRQHNKEPVVVLSLGCGGMELERQVIYQLMRTRFNFPVVFIGVDYSPAIQDLITLRFGSLVSKGLLQVRTISRLGTDVLSELKTQAASQGFLVVWLSGNAFDLKDLPENSFNLVYHTRFKHHLTPVESEKLDKLAIHLAPKVIEFDDLFSIQWFVYVSIYAWRFPAVLNGAIMSTLRYLSKRELLSQKTDGWKVDVFYSKPIWCHLRVYDKAEIVG
jgi:hypothetical protein